jgi:hypothetical protein
MRALVSIVALVTILSGYAQTVSKPFFDAVKTYEETMDITFSFDADLLQLVDAKVLFTSNDLAAFMTEIEGRFPLHVEKVSDEYYTIQTVEKTYQLMVKDSLDGTALDEKFGVVVVVNDESIPTTYENGAWKFSYEPAVNHTISIFSQGYQTAKVPVATLFNSSTLSIALDLPTRHLNTVVVEDYLTQGINMLPSRQQIQIDVNDLPLLPGETDGDIFASIAALPGITNPDGRAGNLFIRGSETDQTLILFDNIPVYHRGHYYGTISPYNPKVIDNVEVYRSGFHPRFGDRVGGAIVINSDNAESSSKYGIGANTLFGMAYGKLRFNDKWSGTFGIRNSYSRKFESPKLTEISESVFSATSLVDNRGNLTEKVEVLFRDYNAKLSFRPNPKNRIDFTALYTFSEVSYLTPPVPNLPRRSVDNKYDNVGLNISWNSQLNNGWRSKASITYSAYDYQFLINTHGPNTLPKFSKNSIDDFNVVQEFERKGKYSNMQFGIDYKYQEVVTGYQNELRDSTIYNLNQSNNSNTVSPFANYEYFGWDKWYLQLGFRATYYSALEDYSISPRVLVNYDLTNSFTLKSSFGWYNQFLSQVKNLEFTGGGFDNELWTLANGESGFKIQGTQSMFGGVLSIHDWVFDVEGFYKKAENLTVYTDRVLGPTNTYFGMDQEAYGVDLLLKKQVSEGASIWAGYSYHDSKIELDTTDQVTYKSKFVQPHVVFFGGALQKNRWKVSAGWKYASGLNARSLEIAYAEVIFKRGPQGSGGPPPGSPPPENPFKDVPERYPNILSLDVSASYKIPATDIRKWSATFGLSLLNVLNQENLIDRAFRGKQGFIDRNAIGFAPNLMVIVEW